MEFTVNLFSSHCAKWFLAKDMFNSAIVTYLILFKSSASRAKRKVKHLKRGTPPIAIYWASKQSKGSKSERGRCNFVYR